MKNDKKNGFTLIELIVTIAIMALIGLVISTNMLGMFSKEQDKEYEDFKRRVEEAACMYFDVEKQMIDRDECRNNNCEVRIADLITKGYIDEDLKNPSTGNVIDKNQKIEVKWINNEKQCEYKE